MGVLLGLQEEQNNSLFSSVPAHFCPYKVEAEKDKTSLILNFYFNFKTRCNFAFLKIMCKFFLLKCPRTNLPIPQVPLFCPGAFYVNKK